MRRRRERSTRTLDLVDQGHAVNDVVGVAVEAKLFGRFRLLTIDAVVHVEREGPGRIAIAAPARRDGVGACRSDVEAVLWEARQALESWTAPRARPN